MNKRISGEQRWKKLVQAQVVSGFSVERFCHVKKICKTSFYAWRKQFGMFPKSATSVLPTTGPDFKDSGVRNSSKRFIRLIPPVVETTPLSVEIPNGYKVNTGYGGHEGLKDLLQILRVLWWGQPSRRKAKINLSFGHSHGILSSYPEIY